MSLTQWCEMNKKEHLLKEWHPTKNGDLTPDDVTAGSGKKVWWILPYDDPDSGKHFDFEWEARISNRCNGSGCPYLPGRGEKGVWPALSSLAATHPELAHEWHPDKNGSLTPELVSATHTKQVWWLAFRTEKDGTERSVEWCESIAARVKRYEQTGTLSCPEQPPRGSGNNMYTKVCDQIAGVLQVLETYKGSSAPLKKEASNCLRDILLRAVDNITYLTEE